MARVRLYDANGEPNSEFNKRVWGWLDSSIEVKEHQRPAQFEQLRAAYDEAHSALLATGLDPTGAHSKLLSELTELIQGQDLSKALSSRLSAAPINETGFRTALSQGFAKNAGENFINVIVYALAQIFGDQDRILVDKGTPPPLRELLTLRRVFQTSDGDQRDIVIPI